MRAGIEVRVPGKLQVVALLELTGRHGSACKGEHHRENKQRGNESLHCLHKYSLLYFFLWVQPPELRIATAYGAV